jgi:hypothetical protein
MKKSRSKPQKRGRGERDIECYCYDGGRCWKEFIEVE